MSKSYSSVGIDFDEVEQDISKLRKQSKAWSQRRGGASTGDMVPIDYFALQHLLDFYTNYKLDLVKIRKVLQLFED